MRPSINSLEEKKNFFLGLPIENHFYNQPIPRSTVSLPVQP